MRNYKNIRDNIAFLSPCVAKSDEIHDANTKGFVNYNVTFSKLLEYIARKNINIDKYDETEYDDVKCDLGLLFSRPGGLRENIELKAPGTWVRQIEGQHHAYEYLRQYEARIEADSEVPQIIDILNCSNGCNIGSATCKD
jgi:iron only hydrogenase large subunit-like protein